VGKKLPEGKIQINLIISFETYNTLLKYVEHRHGKIRGLISKTIEDILNYYFSNVVNPNTLGGLGSQPPQHTHTQIPPNSEVNHELVYKPDGK